MKTQILTLFVLLASFTGYGQQQTFNCITMGNTPDQQTITFTLPKEVNVRHYRIEAGNDSAHFEVLATVPSSGNTMLGRTYSYDLGRNNSYKYYRIGMVVMGQSLVYSQVISMGNLLQKNCAAIPGNMLVNK